MYHASIFACVFDSKEPADKNREAAAKHASEDIVALIFGFILDMLHLKDKNQGLAPKKFASGATHIWAACADVNSASPGLDDDGSDDAPPSNDTDTSMVYVIGILAFLLAGAMFYIVKSRRHRQ